MSWYCGSQETATGCGWLTTRSQLCKRLSCVTMTPFGLLVEPEVYWMNAISCVPLAAISLAGACLRSSVTIHASRARYTRWGSEADGSTLAVLVLSESWQPRLVKTPEASQSFAMCLILYRAASSP